MSTVDLTFDPIAASYPSQSAARPTARAVGAALAVLAVAVGLVVWAVSLRGVDADGLSDYGLTPELPVAWWCVLAAFVAGAATTISVGRPRPWLFALFLAGIVVVLYGTLPVVADMPQYAWTYKHIGVTRYLELAGQTDPSIDIYNRWPGFFALTAAFGSLAGRANPVDYAAWAELVFALLDAALVAAAVRAVARDVRVAAGAALLFTLTNWVGQGYFAPQALGFTLALALLTVVLHQPLRAGGRLTPRALRAIAWASRRPQAAPAPSTGIWPRHAALGAIVALDATIVVTHQLTPYIVLAQVAGLAMLGLAGPRRLVVALALLPLAWLALNFGYVNEHYGLLTGLNPFNNAGHASVYDAVPTAGKNLQRLAGQALALLLWGSASLAVVRLARCGLAGRALPLIVLAAAPFALIFGQSYGGEATLRVLLFSSPWCAALVVWAITTVRPDRVRRLLLPALALTCAGLFVPAFFGQSEINVMPAGVIRASDYVYAHAQPGESLMLAAPNFPVHYGPGYVRLAGPANDNEPNLLTDKRFRHRPLGAADVAAVIASMRLYSAHGYIAFSSTEDAYARAYGLVSPGRLEDLEAAIAASPAFRLWHRDDGVRIYQLVAPERVGG